MFLFVNCVSCVSCIGRWILYHCATWEALILDYKYKQCGIQYSPSELLHSVWQPLGPFMLLQMALFHYFYGLVIFQCVIPGDSVVKNLPANVWDAGLISGSGRSPGKGSGNPLQHFCLGNFMDRRVWPVTVHEVNRVRDDLETKTITIIFHCVYVPYLLYPFLCQ